MKLKEDFRDFVGLWQSCFPANPARPSCWDWRAYEPRLRLCLDAARLSAFGFRLSAFGPGLAKPSGASARPTARSTITR